MERSSAYTSTIVIGLNPALQRRFVLSSKTPFLTPGNVHRASEIQEGIGGKGQDVYVALHCLSSFTSVAQAQGQGQGHSDDSIMNGTSTSTSTSTSSSASSSSGSSTVQLAQFLGKGPEGDTVLSYFLNRYEKDMDLSLTIRTEEKLRVCTTIVNSENDNNNIITPNDESNVGGTELIEPSGTIQQHEIEELRHALKTMTGGGSSATTATTTTTTTTTTTGTPDSQFVRGICIMGSMPPGCPSSLYADMYRTILSKRVEQHDNLPLCMLDTVIGLDHLFHEMNVHRNSTKKTNMIKINMAELCKITGTKTAVYDVANAEIEQVQKAMKALYEQFPESRQALNYVAITNGMFPAFMVHVNNNHTIGDEKIKDDVIYSFTIPKFSPKNNDGRTPKLYTIGAGDAVTASTLAAWEYLTNRKADQRLDETVRASLLKRVVFGEDIANTAFSFGLACGTASCIEKENSVFAIPNVLELFERMERPRRVR